MSKLEKTAELSETRLTVRFTEKEFDVIRKKSDELGCSFSETVRRLAFGKTTADSSNFTEKDMAKRTLLAMQGVRSEFKKIAATYSSIADTFIKNADQKNRSGNPAVSVPQTVRVLRSLETLTIELQDGVNRIFEVGNAGDGSEIHPVRRRTEIKRLAEMAEAEETNSYYYMEKIEIIGRASEDASVYKSQNGVEKAMIKIKCEGRKGGGGGSREWLVFYPKADIAERIKAGSALFVSGDFSVSDKGVLTVFAKDLKFFSGE